VVIAILVVVVVVVVLAPDLIFDYSLDFTHCCVLQRPTLFLAQRLKSLSM